MAEKYPQDFVWDDQFLSQIEFRFNKTTATHHPRFTFSPLLPAQKRQETGKGTGEERRKGKQKGTKAESEVLLAAGSLWSEPNTRFPLPRPVRGAHNAFLKCVTSLPPSPPPKKKGEFLRLLRGLQIRWGWGLGARGRKIT